MAERPSTTKRALQERSIPPQEGGWRLGRWVFFSFFLHGMLISGLFVFPYVPLPKAPAYPTYTVDLVGGEKLGQMTIGSVPEPAPPPKPAPKPVLKKEPKKVKVEPPPPPPVKKKEAVKEKKPVVKELKKEATKEPQKEPSKEAMKEATKEAEVAQEPPPKPGLSEEVREKLIQAALDRVKNRAEAERKKKEEEVALQSGTGEGEGAAALGEGGKGGGIVKGIDFIIYRNRMLHVIRESWTWVGKRNDLEVTVRFGVQENGEIMGLKIVQASGDPSFDDSVFRAVKKASPLPPPPGDYRREFMDVELTFRPRDLGG